MRESSIFRPNGPLDFIFSNIEAKEFSFLGCVGTEDRCVTAFSELVARKSLRNISLAEITDAESEYSSRSDEKMRLNRKTFEDLGVSNDEFRAIGLLDREDLILSWIEDFIEVSEKVVLDISSLPKRFFFPAVKMLLKNKKITDLVVTYSVPDGYHSGNIAERPSDWRALPLFGSQEYPDPKYELAIVGVGFLPFGLPDLLKSGFLEAKPHLFFPFPASPGTAFKSWDFVRQIENSMALPARDQLVHINAMDPSDAFDHIMWLTHKNKKKALFAPYGPKPMSLAMAIYASLTGAPVFYTQPRVYHPDYTSGVRKNNGRPLVYAYCLRLDSRDLFYV
ncbi:hypothetical protein LPN04_09640 [Rugamonas sp. A1-17]|nr:hypothetical protein [Rugamonas sp. A1-17]